MAKHPTYCGPKIQIQPALLQKYEDAAIYVAEEKLDGVWAEVYTDSEGRISKIVGRSGKTFSGSAVQGLIGLQTRLLDTRLIAELEAGTEASVRRSMGKSHKRLFVFDIVQLLGQSTTHLVQLDRRALLEKIFETALVGSSEIKLVRSVQSHFADFFEEITREGGEGLVLKRIDRHYRAGCDGGGKTDEWIRCKRFRYVDYVVMSIGRSEGGSPNFQVGLFVHGKLTRVATIKNIPDGLDYASLVGRVIECKGAEIHSSGALRHGHFHRARNDKELSECTLEAAIRS